ncbi:UNVERIFIED_CONTAM: hypothetical protein Sindi_2020500 [Sesamum indicum]
MKGGDQCSRIFFRKIARRRATRRILQITDAQRVTHTDPDAVTHEFVSYYQTLLGGERRQQMMDFGYLRPRGRHILTKEEADHLIANFIADDVKNAVFDIGEDKAPGPDGFSLGFFRAACPVFAFIPGRSIGNNVMFTHELFSGYNQARLPPRCALKVDIRKAYDTVEWDFLLEALKLFGFPEVFRRWIEECITSTSFSVGMNGKPNGFFKGARGLQQGDPLSPYLFVLVMEILHMGFLQLIDQHMNFTFHWKCEVSRMFQLGFADDLILFCRADIDSIRVLKNGLDRFATWSGLRLNIEKSYLIISKSTQNVKEQLLGMLGFQEGHLPMRYLGLPLICSRLTIFDCQPLLRKIDERINGWEGLALSYAGRVQLIKSVLMAFTMYWGSAFILPKVVLREIEKSYPRESMVVAIDYGHGVLRNYYHTASYLWRIRSDYLEIYEWEPHHSGALSAYDATGTESRLDFTTFRPSEDSSSYVHPVVCDSGEVGHNG